MPTPHTPTKPLQVALQAFRDDGSVGAADRAARVRETTAKGLAFNGQAVAMPAPPIVDTSTNLLPDCAALREDGVDVLIDGTVDRARPSGEDVVALRIVDVRTCATPETEIVSVAGGDLHHLGAATADEIIRVLTGQRGVAATEIAFVSDREHAGGDVMVMWADGGQARFATRSDAHRSFPAWEPGLDSIVYTVFKAHTLPRLYLSTRADAEPGPLLATPTAAKPGRFLPNVLPGDPVFRAVFLPDDSGLALVSSADGVSDLYLVTRAGKPLHTIGHSDAIEVSPTFSPDAKQIAFVSDRGGTPQIYVCDLACEAPRLLTKHGAYNASPVWSPDGRWIAYVSMHDNQFDIWRIPPEGGTAEVLVAHPGNDEDPTWSPDGRKLAFAGHRTGGVDIFVLDVATKALTRITDGTGTNKNPAWGGWRNLR